MKPLTVPARDAALMILAAIKEERQRIVAIIEAEKFSPAPRGGDRRWRTCNDILDKVSRG